MAITNQSSVMRGVSAPVVRNGRIEWESYAQARLRATYEGQLAEARARLEAEADEREALRKEKDQLKASLAMTAEKQAATPPLPFLSRPIQHEAARAARCSTPSYHDLPPPHLVVSPRVQAEHQSMLAAQQREHSQELARLLQQQEQELVGEAACDVNHVCTPACCRIPRDVVPRSWAGLRNELEDVKTALKAEESQRRGSERKAEQANLQLQLERTNYQKLQRQLEAERVATAAAKQRLKEVKHTDLFNTDRPPLTTRAATRPPTALRSRSIPQFLTSSSPVPHHPTPCRSSRAIKRTRLASPCNLRRQRRVKGLLRRPMRRSCRSVTRLRSSSRISWHMRRGRLSARSTSSTPRSTRIASRSASGSASVRI